MLHEQLILDLKKEYPFMLIAVSISLEDYLAYYKKASPSEIEKAKKLRSGDMSQGSTYILNLERDESYRFKDHYRFQGKAEFKGFVTEKNQNKIYNPSQFNLALLKKYVQDLLISEVSSSGEVHDGTPIRFLTVVPFSMGVHAIKTKKLDFIRKYEREIIGHKRIPDPGEKVPIGGAYPIIV